MRVHSLTTRFLLVLLLCTAAPFLAFGLYVRGEVREREEQDVVSFLPHWAEDASLKIEKMLDSAQRVGWTLAGEAETYLREDSPAFEQNISGIFGKNEEFDMVILALADGTVDMVTRHPNLVEQGQDELDALQPESVKQYPWFKRISEKDGEQQVWVSRHTSPFLHRNTNRRSQDPNDYSMGLAIQVMTKGGSYGALFILLNWEDVQKVVDETCAFLREEAGFASAEVFLCDASGRILAHSDRKKYGDNLVSDSLAREVLKAPPGHAFFTDDAGELRGMGFASLQDAILGAPLEWRIGLHAPVVELFAASREFGRQLMLIVPLIVLLLVILAVLSSRAIVRPVRLLSAATEKVAHGDLSARVEARGGDELADLGRAFNTMAEDLATNREQLRVAERQAAWAEMARQVAHEIKNPLTPMRMGAQMLLRALREDDPRWRDLSERLAKNVVQQTEALDRIASDFRQFAGSPVRHLETIAADRMLGGVEELVASLAEESKVDMTFEPQADGAMVEVDVQEMRRVFLNLIHNSMQACQDDGAIRITSVVGEGEVEFRIEDGGVGIPEETWDKLFDPYFTTKTSGTGLGLAICRRLLEAHGGDIKLESSAPPKTVFLVTLPIVPGA